ncbi:MAG: type IV toxin-antitoxin system AbiEi family antitoxin domain-containing protein [Spirochaetota bacterium]
MEHGRVNALDEKLGNLFAISPVQRSKDLEAAGIARVELTRAVAAGTIKRLSRGVYSLADFRESEHGALALVAEKAPESIICLLSALSYHDLTTQAPFEVWIALASKAWIPKMAYPSLRITRFGGESLAYGVMTELIDGVVVKVTTIEKTITDCFKYRTKVGLDVALEALREAGRVGRLDRDALWACAKVDRVTTVILPYMEALA